MLNTRVVALSVQLVLMLAIAASPAVAAPAALSISERPVCLTGAALYPLGIDGGLTALSRNEIPAEVAAVTSARPLGVDGGVLGLLFAGSRTAQFAASTGNACVASATLTGG